MGGSGQRARLILFLVVVLVPFAVLLYLGMRIMREDRDLRWVRRAAERQQVISKAQAKLSAALAPILKHETLTDLAPREQYRHPETVFVAWASGDRLTFPWDPERDRVARACRQVLSQPKFAAALRACDLVKSRAARASQAGTCYASVARTAGRAEQVAYARWLWARDLSESGRSREAVAVYRELLRGGAYAADENGVPLALLAAHALVQNPAYRKEVVGAVESVMAARPWLSPVSCYMANGIARRLAAEAKPHRDVPGIERLVGNVASRVRMVQQAEGLQNSLSSIREQLKARHTDAWAAFGDDPWLVGIADPRAPATAIVIVRGQEVLRSLAIPGAVRLAGASDLEGDVLGPSFPGLKLVLSNSRFGPEEESNRGFLNLALMLVAAATAFAAWLLWRDLRREMQVAELRTQLVASVSHELKTPLTAIRMFAETLQMGRCRDRQVEEEYLGTIVNECERLSRLVDGVLRFSRGEQGKRAYRFRLVQPEDAIRAAARAMEYPLSQHGFRLHISEEDDVPLVWADQDALEQAVLNLLSNAMKYSEDARDIELGVYSENGDAVIRVADHGIGIPREEHSHIFDKFYRVPSRENQLVPGAGLGLALVAQIAAAHGGRVEVQSAPGEGSVFLIRLPALAGSAAEEKTHEYRTCD